MNIKSASDIGFRLPSLLCSIAAMGVCIFRLAECIIYGTEPTQSAVQIMPMAPISAVLILMVCLAVLLQFRRRTKNASPALLAATVMLACTVVIITIIDGWNRSLGLWFSGHDNLQVGIAIIGRISPITAAMIALTAFGLLLQSPYGRKSKSTRQMATILCLAITIACLAVVFSYSARLPLLYGSGAVPMSLAAAICLACLGVGGILIAKADVWPMSIMTFKSELPSKQTTLLGPSERSATIVLVLLAGVILGAYMLTGYAVGESIESRQGELSATAQFKADGIARWYDERVTDANKIFNSPIIATHAAELLTHRSDKTDSDALIQWAKTNIQITGYCRIRLFDSSSKCLLNASKDDSQVTLSKVSEGELMTALKTGKTRIVDLTNCIDCQTKHPVGMYIWIPVTATDGKVIGAWQASIDPNDYLYPLIQTWPTGSKTGETVLIRRDGNDALFLNKLRHADFPPLSHRIPLDRNSQLPAAMAIHGHEGIIEGNDYRNVPVLAAARPIKGTPWYIVAKVDKAEVYAIIRARAIGTGILTSLLLAAILFGFGFFWQRTGRKMEYLQKERLLVTLQSIGDGVIVTDVDGNVTMLNAVAEELTEWSSAQATGQPLTTVFRIVNEISGQPAENPVQKVLKTGSIVNLANHTSLISRSGKIISIADSGAPIRDANGTISGVILVFRNVTEKMLSEKRLQESENRFRLIFESMDTAGVIYRTDDEGKNFIVADFNRSAERIEQIPREMVIGKEVEHVFPGIINLGLLDVFRRVWKSGQSEHLPTKLYDDNRISGWRDNYVYRLPSGEVVAIYTDQTENKRQEELLTFSLNEAQTKQAEFTCLYEATRSILSSPSFAQTAALLSEKCKLMANAQSCIIALLDDSGKAIGSIIVDGDIVDSQRQADMAGGLLAQVCTSRQTAYCNNFDEENRLGFDIPGLELKNVILTPMIIEETVVGAMGLANKSGGFDDNDLRIISAFGDLAAIAMNNFRNLETIASSEEKYRNLVETAYEGICSVDENYNVTFVNDQMGYMLGYSKEEMLEKNIADFVAPSDIDDHRQMVRMQKSGFDQVFERRFVRKDGSICLCLLSAKSLKNADGVFTGAIAMAIDITEQKRMEESLHENEFKLGLALRSTGMGTWQYDLVENKRYFDEQTCRILGLDPAKFHNQPEEFFQVVHPDDIDKIKKSLSKTLQTGAIYEPEYRVIWPDGSVHHIIARGGLVRDNDGKGLRINGIAWDVSDRKNAEIKLRESQQKFADIFRLTPEMISLSDLETGTFTEVNETFEKCMGFSRNEVIGKTAIELGIWKTQKHRDDVVRKISKTGQVNSNELELYRKDGSPITALYSASIIEINQRKMLLSIVTDISARKKIEEQNLFLAEIIKNSPLAVIITDRNDMTTYINPAAEKLFGYTQAELLGKDPFVLRAHDVDENIQTQISDSLHKTGSWGGELKSSRKNGPEFRIYSRIFMLKNAEGKFIANIGFHEDITQRKLAEQAIRESEDKFRIAFQTSPDAIAITSMDDGKYMDFNDGYCEMTGYSRQELAGRSSLNPCVWTNPTERDKLISLLKSHGTADNYEITFMRKDGGLRTGLMSTKIVHIGNQPHLLSITRDITERKLLEDRLRQVEKMQAVGQLAGGVAHDFNNQLAGMMGFAEILKRSLTDEKLAGYADKIITSGQRSAELVKQLLAFARKGRYQTVPASIHHIVRDVVDIISRTFPKNIDIKTQLNAENDIAVVEQHQIQNAILNLAINARDAMPSGGTLTFTSGIMNVDMEYCQRQPFEMKPGMYIWVKVSDTGCGISKENLRRIFEPFFTTKPQGKGTGLGLASVYGTAKGHGGFIVVESELGKGSDFTLHLPMPEGDPGEKPASAPTTTQRQPIPSLKILIIDDEKAFRDMVSQSLRQLGHSPHAVDTAAKGVSYYRNNHRQIDLILLDMAMPVHDGPWALEKIMKISPSAKIIVATGYSIDGDARAMLTHGAACLIQKPFTQDELNDKIALAMKGVGGK